MKYSDEQLKILENNSNYQQVIAAAGSGKTSTMIGLLQKIIKDGKEKQEEILVITFSKKAVQEISERLERVTGKKNKVMIKTFHAYCLYILKKYHPSYMGKETSIVEPKEKEQFFRDFFRKERFKIGGIPYDLLLEDASVYLNKNFPDLFSNLILEYNKYKTDNKKLDFDDLIHLYLIGLENQEDWTFKAKKEVKRVIVDEFQDTDLTQLKWLKLLNPEKLTVVGDDWQAIYGFRGASTIPFLKFQEYFSPCNVQFLTTNYRSLPGIVDLSSIPISKNKNNISKKVKAKREGKANIWKIKLLDDSSNEEFKELFINYLKIFSDSFILCRSNYRIDHFIKLGISKDNIITIHASKGLEFHSVFVDLAGGWNLMGGGSLEIIEEERRILYVAISRAKDNLFLLGKESLMKKKLEDQFFSYFQFRVREIKINNLYKLMEIK